jgi:purine-binding chemotaxis protein CheW
LLARETARFDTLLVFEVDGHRYALHASEVNELVRAALPARLAQTPDVIEGILSIRGRIAAVLDLRVRFGLPQRPMRTTDVLILCEVGARLLALHADSIVDLLHVPASSLVDAQGVGPTARYARGVVALHDGLLLIADIPAFLDEAESQALTRALSLAAEQAGEAT